MTEIEIIKGCIQEDNKCQRELFQRYAGIMFAVCLRYARHRMEAEDLLQDAFIKVFNNISRFKGEGSFEGWIRRIVINTALKNYQKSSFQKERIGLEDFEESTIEPSIYSALGEGELMDQIAKLPDGYRIVFNLYVIEGYSHKEIAETIGIGESTSRSQLVKARKMLQGQILDMQKVAS